MNTTKNEINEAIALAKAVRQTALANAKVALEEQFNEKYQALFANKLKEESGTASMASADTTDINETDVDALIKELESDIEGAGSPEGAAPSPTAEPSLTGSPEGASATPAATATPAPEGVTAPEGTPVVVAPVIVVAPDAAGAGSPVPSAPSEPAGAPELPPSASPEGGETPVDEEINLDELLESLKNEIEGKEDKKDDKECLDEEKKLSSSGIGGKTGGSDNKKPSLTSSKLESGGISDNGIPESKKIKDDATEASRPNQAKNATSTNLSTPSKGGETGPALKAARPNGKGEFENTPKLSEDVASKDKIIAEQSQAINYLKNELNEINLLNAKLLYTNKLFKEHSVNGEQKMRIVEMFDLSKTIREVKMTYANINESLSFSATAPKKEAVKTVSKAKVQAITEGLETGAVGSTKPSREIISESAVTEGRNRFQELAGIKLPAKK